MPKCFRDSVLVPIPKSGKNLSISDNYHPISLASSLSKILYLIILDKYSHYLLSNQLQFGFKSGSSTSLCTGLVNNIVSRYIFNGSTVLGFFLDASKAFDLVDHGKLFSKLQHRGLPTPILRFLVNWYSLQEMRVRWGDCFSEPFGVSKGGVLSPVLFAVYLDGLLEEFSDSGVGCYWGHMFAGALCHVRLLLDGCWIFAVYMLMIMVCWPMLVKLSLFVFVLAKTVAFFPLITFNNTALPYRMKSYI